MAKLDTLRLIADKCKASAQVELGNNKAEIVSTLDSILGADNYTYNIDVDMYRFSVDVKSGKYECSVYAPWYWHDEDFTFDIGCPSYSDKMLFLEIIMRSKAMAERNTQAIKFADNGYNVLYGLVPSNTKWYMDSLGFGVDIRLTTDNMVWFGDLSYDPFIMTIEEFIADSEYTLSQWAEESGVDVETYMQMMS